MLEVTYEPDAVFQTQGIREAAVQVGGTVAQIQIVARGRLESDDAGHYFVAGPNRFRLSEPSSIPVNKTISITGTVDDSESTYRLTIMQTRPVSNPQ